MAFTRLLGVVLLDKAHHALHHLGIFTSKELHLDGLPHKFDNETPLDTKVQHELD